MFNYLAFALPLIMFPIIIIVFVLVNRFVRQPLGIEEGKTPIHSEICGAYVANSNSTYPFVRVALYDEFIVIKKLFNTTVLNYKDIADASLSRFSIAKSGIKITHKRSDIHERVIIWTFNPDTLLNKLHEKLKENI